MSIKIFHMLLLAFSMVLASPIASAANIDTGGALVLAVSPQVTASFYGKTVPLVVKMNVPVTATVVSDAQGWAQLMFSDASTISISPNSELELTEFVDTPTEQSVLLHLTAGTARVVTGDISRRNPRAVRVKTPQATVGIRGTIVSIRVVGDKTTILLTETSGLGVTVTNHTTGATVNLTTPGHVLEVSPSGVKERPATPAEAQANNRATRGQNATSQMAQMTQTTQTGQTGQSTASAEIPLAPTLNLADNAQRGTTLSPTAPAFDLSGPNMAEGALPGSTVPESNIPNANTPGTNFPPAHFPTEPLPDFSLPDDNTSDGSAPGPIAPSFNVAHIQGLFIGHATSEAELWSTMFAVTNARIYGALISRMGIPFAINGSGNIAPDATFTVNNFLLPKNFAPDTQTSMDGVFTSLNGGSFNIVNGPNLNVNGNFTDLGRRLSGDFMSTGNIDGNNWTALFNVNQHNIRNASLTIDNAIRASGGKGTVEKDLSFAIGNFSGNNNWDDLTMNGQFKSVSGGTLNINGSNIKVDNATLQHN